MCCTGRDACTPAAWRPPVSRGRQHRNLPPPQDPPRVVLSACAKMCVAESSLCAPISARQVIRSRRHTSSTGYRGSRDYAARARLTIGRTRTSPGPCLIFYAASRAAGSELPPRGSSQAPPLTQNPRRSHHIREKSPSRLSLPAPAAAYPCNSDTVSWRRWAAARCGCAPA